MTSATTIPTLTLRDDVEIPQLGFGVFQVPPEETQRTVEAALELGYRHIDTAAAYGNEVGVGEALVATGLGRDEVFITTKLSNADHGFDATLAAAERSRERLGVEFVDLYLIHWPMPPRDLFLETWNAFERIQSEGGARSIGVSNFRVEDLERLEQEAELQPSVNQVELHPSFQQAELRAWHAGHGVATEAWSPLAQGQLLDDPTIATVAAHHHRSPAQTILRWHLQLGNIVIPKSVTPERMRENLEIFDFELSEDDLAVIARLDTAERIGPDPTSFDAV